MTYGLSPRQPHPTAVPLNEIAILEELEKRVLWLASWMIHHANHIRPSRDGLKVGGHQASSASVATLMTALYFKTLRSEDRVAVKPHASPVLHAIEYLLGRQTRDQLERFRGLGGAQSYPSRTKDRIPIDFSTGSVGLGVAATLFASIAQDYVGAHGLARDAPGRMIALLGDAELDEGNVYEALLEGWKHEVRNLWWIIDYNRQSLDGVVNDALFGKIASFFSNVGWRVTPLKWGRRLEMARHGPAGEALIDWIERCPNQLYSALTFQGGRAWRTRLARDLAGAAGLGALLDAHDDASLAALMTNLGGHDLATILEAFEAAAEDDAPTAFVAYTIKGHGLPFAGHKDNHAGLMNLAQMATFQSQCGVSPGEEWEKFAGMENPGPIAAYLDEVARRRRPPTPESPRLVVPKLTAPRAERQSTQEAFGKILLDLAREDSAFARRLVTTSPDVTVSTNLSGWVNRRGIFHTRERSDLFQDEKIASLNKWRMAPAGQHIELGIAEHNLFLLLGQLGLADAFWGERLLPVGTVYDPFVNRGLDALIYACYQGARFMIVGTPSGISLAPEGGAHQSIGTPLIGMSQAGLSYFEPAYADELATVMAWAFDHMQAEEGGSVYLRLSTRPLEQLPRPLDETTAADLIEGAYWIRRPEGSSPLALVYCGTTAEEAFAASLRLMEVFPGHGLLAVTSPDRLHAGWLAAQRARTEGKAVEAHIERLLRPLAADAVLVTVMDGHPLTLSWLGSVRRHRVHALGVIAFGQSGDIPDLFHAYRLDARAISAGAIEAIDRRR
ncbi:MAG: transketolase [Hyphomonadaceae bacterium]|nr:transketolase [Hyphomonadaceae bacterium]